MLESYPEGVEMEIQATPMANLYLTASMATSVVNMMSSTTDTRLVGVAPNIVNEEFINDFGYLDFRSRSNWSLHAAYDPDG